MTTFTKKLIHNGSKLILIFSFLSGTIAIAVSARLAMLAPERATGTEETSLSMKAKMTGLIGTAMVGVSSLLLTPGLQDSIKKALERRTPKYRLKKQKEKLLSKRQRLDDLNEQVERIEKIDMKPSQLEEIVTPLRKNIIAMGVIFASLENFLLESSDRLKKNESSYDENEFDKKLDKLETNWKPLSEDCDEKLEKFCEPTIDLIAKKK